MRTKQEQTAALDQVLELVYLLDDDMTRALERDGLTKSRAPLVWALLQAGPSTQRSLADALGTTPRNVTGLVDGLEATGFVSRGPHPTDRRATLVSLTERGSAVMEKLARDHDGLAEQLFGTMSAEELDGFVAGLTTVLGELHTLLGAGTAEAGA